METIIFTKENCKQGTYKFTEGMFYASGTSVKRRAITSTIGLSGNPLLSDEFAIDFLVKPVDLNGDFVNQVIDLLKPINDFYTSYAQQHLRVVPNDFTEALDFILMNAGYIGKRVNSDKPWIYAEDLVLFNINWH